MIPLKVAVKAALGATFNVTHQGSPVTVNVANAVSGVSTPFPAVYVHREFGTGDPADVGGNSQQNEAFLELEIQTIDSDTIDGELLVTEIHTEVQALVALVRKSLGASFFTHIKDYRDAPDSKIGAAAVYTRFVTIRAFNIESY